MTERCETCRFFRMDSGTDPPICRRYAPRPRLFYQNRIDAEFDEIWVTWPKVLPSDWCGEWRPIIAGE